jgi:hypothetical protein
VPRLTPFHPRIASASFYAPITLHVLWKRSSPKLTSVSGIFHGGEID